ncbi:MAG: hypothetical protein HYU67_03400 [Flavobacteriia bacterium]|nr:hypothetical protein [Flavobacteriia bacterium]
MNSYEVLIQQIDSFIKKYYKNLLFKGVLLISIFFIFSYLLVISLENLIHFSIWLRTILFFLFIAANGFVLIKLIIIPLSKLFSFSKGISRNQAAVIIGRFFPEVSDTLLNTLQLYHEVNDKNHSNFELLAASVQQRSEKLKLIPFLDGIQYKVHFKYFKYLLPLVCFFLLLFIFYPSFIKEGTKRVVFFQTEFIPESPFKFQLNNSKLTTLEDSDFSVDVSVFGKYIPNKVYLVTEKGKYLMKKKSRLSFAFSLKKLKNNTIISFESDGYSSKKYTVEVIPKSGIQIFSAFLDYPQYTGKKDELIQNVGDLYIPEGTKINFKVNSKNSKEVLFNFKNQKSEFFTKENIQFTKRFVESDFLKVILKNKFIQSADTSSYKFDVQKDQYPSILVKEEKDSISKTLRFFEGEISDDYGFSSMFFKYNIISKDGKSKQYKVKLDTKEGTTSKFSFAYDFGRDTLKVEDKIEYFFVVLDNDGVNGAKSSKSEMFKYELPTLDELNEQRDNEQENIKNQIDQLIKKSANLNKDIKEFKKEALNNKQSNWEKSNALQNIQQQYNEMNKELDKIQQQWQESNNEKNQLSKTDLELLEKQEELQELLNQIMDQELMDLFKKLEELLKNNQQINQQENELLEMKSEDIKKQLDRSMEMMKRLQVNEKLEDAIKEIKELEKKQEELKNQTEQNKITSDEAKKKQEELNKKFDELKKDLNEIKQLNEDLKSPMNLGNQEDLKNEISNEMEQSQNNLDKNKNKKASENQKNASEKLKQLSNELETLQNDANKQQQEEDMNSIRQILESLMILSFEQENIMNSFSKVNTKDPFYRKLAKKQRKIIDDTKIVEDSLNALAFRQPKIASFINKELNEIKINFKQATENIDEHRKKQIGTHLQYVMTSYNNLALLLNESLQQMQASMQSSSSGGGSCNKPGGKNSKPSDSDSQDMKSMLKKQLEQMQKGQKEGGSKPGEKPGSKPSENGMNMLGLGNKEIAKMAAEQTAIRQKLEQIRNELNKEGKGKGNQLNPLINELEQQEKDLINKQFNKDLIKRQKDILTRLLESEKALMERGFEEKRESKSGKNENFSNLNRINEYNQKKLQQIEQLYSVDPNYYKYYKDKANEYFHLMQ